MNAELTDALTNGMHALWLLIYFVAALLASNVFWIAARKGTEAWIGHELPTAYRYDNDLFHFMLIASTFTVYKAFSRSGGLPVESAEQAAGEEVNEAV